MKNLFRPSGPAKRQNACVIGNVQPRFCSKTIRILSFFILLLAGGCTSSQETSVKQPNIVFIIADDLTWSGIHALGNDEIKTPNIDRLADQGTTFTHAYNMGAWTGAVCIASRTMLISGRTVWNANEFSQRWEKGQDLDKTWGKLMEKQGYKTFMAGKWHVSAAADKVFQQTKNVRPGMPKDAWDHETMTRIFSEYNAGTTPLTEIMPVGYHRPLNEEDTSWSPSDPRFGGFWEGGTHWSEVLRNDAIEFIESTVDDPQPFFMYVAFNAPHDPRQAPREFLDLYNVNDLSLPESWAAEYPYKDGIGNGHDLRDEALAPFPRTEYATKKHLQEYYAITSHLDHQVGLILSALKDQGKMENTYIIFTADHGLAMGRHGLMGKQTLYDHSLRVPFIVAGPDVPPGKLISEDIYIQDAMPTGLELAGGSPPGYVEFNSLLGLLREEQVTSPYPAIYGAYLDLQRMIRKDGFKLLVYPGMEKVMLFDMNNDPEEVNDLAGNSDYDDKVLAMFEALILLQKQMNDELDLVPLYKELKGKTG